MTTEPHSFVFPACLIEYIIISFDLWIKHGPQSGCILSLQSPFPTMSYSCLCSHRTGWVPLSKHINMSTLSAPVLYCAVHWLISRWAQRNFCLFWSFVNLHFLHTLFLEFQWNTSFSYAYIKKSALVVFILKFFL